jgi:PAS domain S-box-containing protein
VGLCEKVASHEQQELALRSLNEELARRVKDLRALGRDLAKQKRAAEALTVEAGAARRDALINAARLRVALGAARAGVIDLDLEAHTAWTSPELAEIVGRPVTFEDFAKQPWAMCHADDRWLLDRLISTWASGRHEPVDFRIVSPTGEIRWIQIHGEKLPGREGRPARIIALVLDIDARKRQELALVEAERAAQAAIEAKDQFLANMSHEIRTPMNGVLGVLHLLSGETLSDEGRRLLAEATNCGRMLSQILNDVIDFSRIESGRLELSPEPLDAADALESVAGLLRPQAEAKGLTIETEVDGGDAWIMADPVRLNQALFNLLGNAVKFTAEGRVEARLTIRDDGEGRKQLRFMVQDTGVGIPQAIQQTLFARFQQADGSIVRRFGGSGLGLAITRSLVEMMGGEVGFESVEGEGSTFWIDLQAPAARKPEPATSADPAAPLEGLRVLVVEDNPTNQIIAVRILEGLGASVDTADDGLEGVRAILDRPYELVLMDVQMPRMSGVEATRRVRALSSPAADVPIIALTANALTHQREEYLATGMNGVVAKPMSPTSLVSEVLRVLNGDKAEAAA